MFETIKSDHPAGLEIVYRAAVEKGNLALARQAAENEVTFIRSFHMGLDYSYRLFFRKNQIWDVLQAVVDIAWTHDPPARIHFPDRVLPIPLDTWGSKEKKDFNYDDPEFNFAIVLNFPEDAAILEYLRARADKGEYNDPPDPDKKHGIGMIYLSIEQEFPEQPGSDLVLFDFGTTGTRMSILFLESNSIRRTFEELLEKVPGICGVINREMNGEVFWFKGQHVSEKISDPYLLPAEIEATLGRSK